MNMRTSLGRATGAEGLALIHVKVKQGLVIGQSFRKSPYLLSVQVSIALLQKKTVQTRVRDDETR